jgi:hypothetical protein
VPSLIHFAKASAMPEPPLDELALRNGTLVHRAPSLPETEYLATAPVVVEAKTLLVELPAGEVSYMFALNQGPDATWIELLTAHLEGLPAEIQGAQLEIRCAPEELERCYARAKELLARTNRDYAEYKVHLIERVAEHGADQLRARRTNEERSRVLRAQFDRLVL